MRKTIAALICCACIVSSALLVTGCAIDGFPYVSATVYPSPVIGPAYYSPFPSFPSYWGGGTYYGCGWRGGGCHWHGGHCHR